MRFSARSNLPLATLMHEIRLRNYHRRYALLAFARSFSLLALCCWSKICALVIRTPFPSWAFVGPVDLMLPALPIVVLPRSAARPRGGFGALLDFLLFDLPGASCLLVKGLTVLDLPPVCMDLAKDLFGILLPPSLVVVSSSLSDNTSSSLRCSRSVKVLCLVLVDKSAGFVLTQAERL